MSPTEDHSLISLSASKGGNICKDGHGKLGKLGNVSSDRYQEVSTGNKDVPSFSKSIRDSFVCAPCVTSKFEKVTIKNVDKNRSKPYKDVHYDISGPFSKSLGGKL